MNRAAPHFVVLPYLASRRLSIAALLVIACYTPALATEAARPAVRIFYGQPDVPRERHYRALCHSIAEEFAQHKRLDIAENKNGTADHVILIRPDAQQVEGALNGQPGARITIIDGEGPSFPATVRDVRFRDQEGAFLIGMIAALTSGTGTVGFIGESESPPFKAMAYGFYQGAKSVNPQINILSDMAGAQQDQATLFDKQGSANADEIFVTGSDGLEGILRNAQQFHRRLMLLDAAPEVTSRPVVVTALNRRVDFALRDALLAIEQNRWSAGLTELGIREGYLDYVLDQDNKSILSHEIVERVEDAKDRIIRGLITVKPYAPQ